MSVSNCCHTTQPEHPNRHVCPVNGKAYAEVPINTIMHHLKHAWEYPVSEQSYYYCDDPDCDVVYFGLDNSTIVKESLRTKVGIKEQSDDSLICYCFGVTRQQSRNCPETRTFVIAQTRNHTCSCATSNPSGRCCLKDFPK